MIVTHALVVGHAAPVATIGGLELASGAFVAIVGPNGVGKTTLLGTLAGRIRTHAGSVTIDGASVAPLRPRARARVLAFLPADDPSAETMPVREAVLQGRLSHRRAFLAAPTRADEAAVTEALARMDLAGFADRGTHTLSSGEAQRVWIATALAQDAPHLLLDEPTSRLDIRNAARLLARLRALAESGKTVVAVLHDLNLAATFAHRILVLAPGRLLADGMPDDVLTSSILSEAYDAPIRVARHDDGGFSIAPRLSAESTIHEHLHA
jgi:iron complex transport system ATP-binding protein